MGAVPSLGMLAGYNAAYLAPFVVVPVLTAVMGEGAAAILNRINSTVERVGAVVIPLILGAVGIALVTDAALYFTRGEGLF